MTPSTRKKVLIGAGGLLGVLVVALLVAPVFLDLNRYKPQIAAEVKQATGRELVIDGPASLSFLPVPTVSVADVRFFNAPGSKNANMVEVKSITVKPALFALLTGSIEASEVTLVEPKIVLEINAQGKPNWEFTPSVAEARPAAPKPSAPMPLSLGRLTIENGTLIFSDSKAGLSVTAEKANVSASVGSIDGPYSLAGAATVNGAPLKIDLSVGAKAGDGFATSLALEAGGGKLGFKGKLSELGPNATVTGLANASADSLSAFIATLVGLAGQPSPAMPPLLASKFSFDGGIEVSQTQVAARDFKMALAGDSGSGSIAVTLKPALAVEGKVVVPKIDLDRTLAELAVASAPPAAGKPAPPAAPTTGSGASVLDALTAKLSIEAAEVIYNKQPIRNFAIELDAKGGAVAVPKFAATLPGDMVLQARSTMSGDAVKPTVAGDFSLVGPKLRDTLGWLAVDVSSVPANKLNRLSLKGRLGSNGGNVLVNDAVFELDEVKGAGGVVVTFSVPLSIVIRLEIDTIDLDSFLGRPADGQKKPPAASAAKTVAPGPTIGLKLKLAKAIYNKETIGGIEADLALKGRTLELADVKVANLGGARLAVRGSVADYDSALPHGDLAFNFEAPDMGRVLKVAGATAPADLGQVTASGGVSGTVEALTFREFRVASHGQSAQIDGTFTIPGAAHGPPSSIGYKGKVMANGQTIEGSVDAKVAARPSVTADLRTTLLDLDRLGGPAPAPARGRPAAPQAGPPSSAIDTSAMRSFDASLKLSAATLVSSPLRLSNADIAVTLKDGVLTLQHLKAGLYGGTLDLSGTVNGSKPALAFDFKGDANNIYLGEMLRGLSGTNQFGGTVKVTIDGRLSATGIALRGAGSTSEQIKASMAGGAQLGGHVFVGADKALTTIGSAAAGAAGGVIDNTLGNALGIVGQKGSVGISNLLHAASLLLNRFVNRDNPISGHIDIAGGTLTDRSLIVSGNRATANIITRTNLAASTTDTTINFVIAEDPSAPYIIATARGPFSNLSYNAVRGTAKDPPGMVNTLTNAVPNAIPNIVPGLGGSGSGSSGGGQRVPLPNIHIPNPFGR
jgi:AsmA family